MYIYRENEFDPDFLQSLPIHALRALIRSLSEDEGPKDRSKEVLLKKFQEIGATCEIEDVVRVLWDVLDAKSGGAFARVAVLTSDRAERNLQNFARSATLSPVQYGVIEPNQFVDGRMVGSRAEVLFIGEAEAEVPDPEQDREEEIGGRKFKFKAYRVLDVPVVAKATIDPKRGLVEYFSRGFHRNVRQGKCLDNLVQNVEGRLGETFPDLTGLTSGIKNLWDTKIRPTRYTNEESDLTKVTVTRAPKERNRSSVEVETVVRNWSCKNGDFKFHDSTVDAKFHVDVGRATFHFTNISYAHAKHVISAIIEASS